MTNALTRTRGTEDRIVIRVVRMAPTTEIKNDLPDITDSGKGTLNTEQSRMIKVRGIGYDRRAFFSGTKKERGKNLIFPRSETVS